MLLFAAVADSAGVAVEDSLLIGVARGDQQAFTKLYRMTGRSVYAYALSFLKNPTDAEDVMQDTFLKIRSAAGYYEPCGKPMAWILTITRNLCLMKLRQAQHLSPYTPEELQPEPDFSQIEDLEDRLVMKTALEILSEEECQIILLHAVTGLKHREIGELLDLPVSTVLSKYSRGLKKLRASLEDKL